MSPGWGFNMSFRVIFEKATADYDIAREDEPLRLFEEGQEKKVVECENIDGYVGEMNHLIECIKLNQQPSVTAEDGLMAVEICTAEEESAKTGRIVTVR